MDVSVAICTWNRARSLEHTLRRMCGLVVPDGLTWELLVVENNCTDDTPTVIQSYAGRLPIVRLVEPAIGLSNARNRARNEARGELLVFTDDDVIVDENWLAALASAAKRWPDAGFFGGPITPLYEKEPPSWFRANERKLRTFVAVARDLGDSERWLQDGEWPWGPNMAYRRAAFERTGFRADIGRRGMERGDREDEVYCETLAAAGFRGVWVPSARVQHVIGPNHLTLSLVRRNYIGQAVTDVRLHEQDTTSVATVFGVPRWLIRATAQAHLSYVWRRMTRSPAWFESFVNAARTWGLLSEYWRRRRIPRRSPARQSI